MTEEASTPTDETRQEAHDAQEEAAEASQEVAEAVQEAVEEAAETAAAPVEEAAEVIAEAIEEAQEAVGEAAEEAAEAVPGADPEIDVDHIAGQVWDRLQDRIHEAMGTTETVAADTVESVEALPEIIADDVAPALDRVSPTTEHWWYRDRNLPRIPFIGKRGK